MTLERAIEILMRVQREHVVWNCVTDLIVHDASTVAPQGSTRSRGEMLAAVGGAAYRAVAADETCEALALLCAQDGALTGAQRRMRDCLARAVRATRSVPEELYVEHERIVSDADAAWHRAKRENDYALFAPHLDRVTESCRAKARCIAPESDPYDYWLDSFQEGVNREVCDAFFGALQAELPRIMDAARSKPAPDALPAGPYPIARQRELSARLMQILRIDPQRCTLGETEHPFTSSMTRDDVRMTTHYYAEDFARSMFSVLHEGGHALYELHVPEAWVYTALGDLRHAAIHESQSRLFENNVGRSRAFLTALAPELRALFPQLWDTSGEALYRALNRCVPSPVRMNADELSYPLHIIVRYRIERALFAGEIRARDVPELWGRMYRELLGVDVPDDARGALQDSHWATGLFGYFPSYALGSAYAAQIEARMRESFDLDACLARLDLTSVEAWLDEHLWRYGAALPPAELLRGAFDAFDPRCYLAYLEGKFL